jgi:cytochrome c-type biogenesis protein CcmH/NrfG
MRSIVLDTNVLLSDPEALFAYPDAEIVIPETVLGELDKLKTARVDPELRFKGREVSRLLFDLSEQGSLIEGVEMPDGGILRVVPFDPESDMPEELSSRNADDRILGVAYKLCKQGCERVTLVTNDLNMLLKAQALGIRVERRADESEGSFSKRFIIRPFQRYKVPLGILAMSLAVFAAIVFVVLSAQRQQTAFQPIPDEFRSILSQQQQQILQSLQTLQANPADISTEFKLAEMYYTLRTTTGASSYGDLATKHFEHILQADPNNVDARTELAALYWLSGNGDLGIQETKKVLAQNPKLVQANFNLGLMLWKSKGDYAGAIAQFDKVIDLTATSQDSTNSQINGTARTYRAQVIKDQQTAQPGSTTATGGVQ